MRNHIFLGNFDFYNFQSQNSISIDNPIGIAVELFLPVVLWVSEDVSTAEVVCPETTKIHLVVNMLSETTL